MTQSGWVDLLVADFGCDKALQAMSFDHNLKMNLKGLFFFFFTGKIPSHDVTMFLKTASVFLSDHRRSQLPKNY